MDGKKLKWGNLKAKSLRSETAHAACTFGSGAGNSGCIVGGGDTPSSCVAGSSPT